MPPPLIPQIPAGWGQPMPYAQPTDQQIQAQQPASAKYGDMAMDALRGLIGIPGAQSKANLAGQLINAAVPFGGPLKGLLGAGSEGSQAGDLFSQVMNQPEAPKGAFSWPEAGGTYAPDATGSHVLIQPSSDPLVTPAYQNRALGEVGNPDAQAYLQREGTANQPLANKVNMGIGTGPGGIRTVQDIAGRWNP
jgi:hypothetical protein